MPVILPADSLIRPGVVIKAEAVLKVADGGREWDSDTDMGSRDRGKASALIRLSTFAAERHHFGIRHRPSVSVEVDHGVSHRHVGGISCQVPVSVLVSSGFLQAWKGSRYCSSLSGDRLTISVQVVVRGIENCTAGIA